MSRLEGIEGLKEVYGSLMDKHKGEIMKVKEMYEKEVLGMEEQLIAASEKMERMQNEMNEEEEVCDCK